MSNVVFTMSALALKLLGKNLYSNPWSALSELIANGIDAKAKNIYLIFNHINDKTYDIYVIDDGSGMNEETIKNYTKIGFQRRKEMPDDSEKVMGRKGIGKLAALFLSDKYDLITKTNESTELKYQFDFRQYQEGDSSGTPSLISVESYEKDEIIKTHIKDLKQYTCIYIREVDLSGYGKHAFESLRLKLSNLFSFKDIDAKIVLKDYIKGIIKTDDKGKQIVKYVEKQVPFKNFMIIYKLGESHIPVDDLKTLEEHKTVQVSAKDRILEKNRKIESYNDNSIIFYDDEGNEVKKKIEGWIAVHASILSEKAVENDKRFSKNNFYNPIQLRIYVRNKLAVENFLDVIGSTQTYANYIEGEIHFDFLDDNSEEDIATTNRQGFDENDIRIIQLKEKLDKVIKDLIKYRLDTVKTIEEEVSKEDSRKKFQAKKEAIRVIENNFKEVSNTFDKNKAFKDIEKEISRKFLDTTEQTLKQEEIEAKDKYNLFFSHKSESQVFSDFIYSILVKRGMKKGEYFYTAVELPVRDLDQQIKNSILNTNTMCVYFFSKDFNKSAYPMLEAGAGWAVKGIEKTYVLADDERSVPNVLNFRANTFATFDKISPKFFHIIIKEINEMISHLNKGRRIEGVDEMNLFESVTIEPDESTDHYLNRVDKTIKDEYERFKEGIKKYIDE